MRSFKNISSDLNEQVPNEWEVTKLNLIANLRRGPFGGALKVDSFVPEGYAVYEQQHAIHKKLSNIRYFIDEKKYKEMRVFKVEENDILLSCSGTIGESVIIPTKYKEGIINQALLRIRLIRPDINIGYFKYFMDSFLFQTLITDNSHGSAMKNIASMNVINKIPVPVPSEDEQEKIVLILNWKLKVLDRTIDMKYKILELLDQQRQSIITEAVTKGLNPNVKMKDSGVEWIGEIPEHWKVKKIKHFATHVGSGKTPSGGSEVYLDEGVPFIRSLNVHFDGIRLKDLVFISEDTNAEMKSSQVQPLDILLNITGASIGRTAIVPKDFGRANVNQHVCIIRLNKKKMYPYYFNMLMASDVINQQIWFAQNGSSREGLNFIQVKELKFAMPPTIEEQREINDWVFNKQKTIYDVMSTIKEQIEKLKEYRQSLIYEAVTGKIDVRDMELDEVR